MAIAAQGIPTTKVSDGITTDWTVSTPAGLAVGDLMLAVFALGAAAQTIAAPAGWTLVFSRQGSYTYRLVVYRKFVEAAEPATHAFTLSGAVSGVLALGGG